MNLIGDAIGWIFGGDTGQFDPIPVAIAGQLLYTLIAMVIAGAIATWGVIQLTKHHPQITSDGKPATPRVH